MNRRTEDNVRSAGLQLIDVRRNGMWREIVRAPTRCRGVRQPNDVIRLGVAHGAFCVGCCWALMLVAFAAGAGNLLWMAALTTVMVIERTVS